MSLTEQYHDLDATYGATHMSVHSGDFQLFEREDQQSTPIEDATEEQLKLWLVEDVGLTEQDFDIYESAGLSVRQIARQSFESGYDFTLITD